MVYCGCGLPRASSTEVTFDETASRCALMFSNASAIRESRINCASQNCSCSSNSWERDMLGSLKRTMHYANWTVGGACEVYFRNLEILCAEVFDGDCSG